MILHVANSFLILFSSDFLVLIFLKFEIFEILNIFEIFDNFNN